LLNEIIFIATLTPRERLLKNSDSVLVVEGTTPERVTFEAVASKKSPKWSQNGRARVLPYDSKLGASYYLTKHVAKDEYTRTENWEMNGLGYLNQLYLRELEVN